MTLPDRLQTPAALICLSLRYRAASATLAWLEMQYISFLLLMTSRTVLAINHPQPVGVKHRISDESAFFIAKIGPYVDRGGLNFSKTLRQGGFRALNRSRAGANSLFFRLVR